MNIVIGTERNYLEVWRNVVYYASSDAVDIEVVGVHERHASQEEDSAADFAQRLIRWREVHSHD